MEYVNLDLELSEYQRDTDNQETFSVHVVRSDCGTMPSDKAVPVTLTSEQRKKIGSFKKRGLTKEEMIERGEALGQMLFPPDTQVRRIYDKCLNTLKEAQRLRIRLTLGNYALSDLPWEYAYILPPDTPADQKDLRGFLVLNKQISLVRYPAIEQKVVSLDPLETGKLRMVVVMANPKNDPDYRDLKIGDEFKKIKGVLEKLPLITPEPYPDATRETVQDALMNPAHIFHFAGHGDFEADLGADFRTTSGHGHIILLNEEGKGDRFPADNLASLLRASQVRLAVLTACESGETDQMNAWTGVVPALIHEGIPAVVGMQFKITDENAIAFSRQFYLALANGLPIDAAVAEGRQAIYQRGNEDERDWGVPVLYLQTDRGVLFPMKPKEHDHVANGFPPRTDIMRPQTPRWKRLTVVGSILVPVIVFVIANIANIEHTVNFFRGMFGQGKTVQRCDTLAIATYPKFPFYLINTFKEAQRNNYIYWAVLKGENKCGERINTIIKFNVVNKEVATASDEPHEYTVEAGSSINERLNPYFKFNKEDVDTSLTVSWKIINSKTGGTMNSKTPDIEVLSKKYVLWELKDADGKDVPLEFLLASLSAWAIKPDSVTRRRAGEFLKQTESGITSSESFRQWLARAYSSLFHTEPRLVVNPYLEPWPPTGKGIEARQQIRSPSEVLKEKNPDSVETALLFAALRNGVCYGSEPRLVLFALPHQQQENRGARRFLLSWSTQDQDWHAIDLTHPNTVSFKENESQASPSLNNFLKSQGDILTVLKKQGVFVDKGQSVFALDFQKAAKFFQIGGLP